MLHAFDRSETTSTFRVASFLGVEGEVDCIFLVHVEISNSYVKATAHHLVQCGGPVTRSPCSFIIFYNRERRLISLDSDTNISIRGVGLGGYLRDLVVNEIKFRCSGYSMLPAWLSSHDSYPDNHERRHRFYEGVGMTVTYKDTEGPGGGEVTLDDVNNLKIRQLKPHIRESSLIDYGTSNEMTRLDSIRHTNEIRSVRNSYEQRAKHLSRFYLPCTAILGIVMFFLGISFN
jgi:hypothetical protein